MAKQIASCCASFEHVLEELNKLLTLLSDVWERSYNSEHLLANTNLVVIDGENKEEELDQTAEVDAFSPGPENQNAWLEPLLYTRPQSQFHSPRSILGEGYLLEGLLLYIFLERISIISHIVM